MRELREAVVYGKPRQRECSAVAEGLSALGAAVRWHGIGYFDESDVFDVDVAVTFGQRLWSGGIAEAYRKRGVPVLTIDLPPIRVGELGNEQRSLWLDRVNWIPDEALPTDRFERLGLGVPTRRYGTGVLLCGQVSDDAAHGMDAVDLRQWAQTTADAIGEFDSVTWRPHPHDKFQLDGFPMQVPTIPFHEVLERKWWAVATYNSTCGVEALLSGLPVFCSQSSFYGEIANTSLAALSEPHFPDPATAESFFSRLAYTQWTFDELASGEAVAFALESAGFQSFSRPHCAA